MVKYDSKLKSMIINEHLNNDVSGAFLAQKYDLPRNIVNAWIKKFHLGVQVSLYNHHKNGKYSSYKGTVGTIADNILKQNFSSNKPYEVLHTDITQVKLNDKSWAYISDVTDEASKEILAFKVSNSPSRELITNTINELISNMPIDVNPIIHSDQGWQYQLDYYMQQIKNNNFIQSMSRKGNCHDNAPMESFFHLYKTECLFGLPACQSLEELISVSSEYIDWFNNYRISLKTKGMSPCEYRKHTLAA